MLSTVAPPDDMPPDVVFAGVVLSAVITDLVGVAWVGVMSVVDEPGRIFDIRTSLLLLERC
jgi:hypothetical protein